MSEKKQTLLSRTVRFTENGILLIFQCAEPLCTYHQHKLITHDELAVHTKHYDCSVRQAVLDNYRAFKQMKEKHSHVYWSYEI